MSLKKNEIIYTGPLTGTISEANGNEEFGEEFEPLSQVWGVNPVDETEYDGTLGYKDN